MKISITLRRGLAVLTLGAVLGGAAVLPAQGHDLEITNAMLVWNGAPRADHATSVRATLVNICDLLHQRDADANFALAPDLQDIDVADLKLDAVSMEQILEAIRIASGSRFVWNDARLDKGALDPTTGLPIPASGPKLYALMPTPTTAPALQVEAFSIGRYLAAGGEGNAASDKPAESPEARAKRQDEQVAQINLMVDETMDQYQQMLNESHVPGMAKLPHPVIKFHPGANLLVVIGDPRAVAIAAKVICALPGVQRSGASAWPAANSYGMSGLRDTTTLSGSVETGTAPVEDAFNPSTSVPVPQPSAPAAVNATSATGAPTPTQPARRF